MSDAINSARRIATKAALDAGSSRVTVLEAGTVQINEDAYSFNKGVQNMPTILADYLVASGLATGKTTANAGPAATKVR